MVNHTEQTTRSKTLQASADSSAHPAEAGSAQTSSSSLIGEYMADTMLSQGGKVKAGAPQQAWTVAVDLAVVMDDSGARGMLGAQDKEKLLEELAGETKAKRVSIVVQSLVPTGVSSSPYSLERRIIKDGTVSAPVTHSSQGTALDLQHLISYATSAEPSSKIALAMNVHGGGDGGASGGSHALKNGHANVEDLVNGIRKGLSGSTHAKLDMLDLDSCLMGQMGVANKMAAVTDHAVLSELREQAVETTKLGPSVDAQNLNSWIGDLLQNPGMDGKQLADKVVAEAANHANTAIFAGGTAVSGAPTLAHFELGLERERFMQSLNQLGDLLHQTLQDPDARLTVETLIDHSPNLTAVYEKGRPAGSDPKVAKFDLNVFLSNLEIAARNFNGHSEALVRDIDNVKARQKSLLASAYLEGMNLNKSSFGGTSLPPSLGGLSVFLPTKELRNPSTQKVIGFEPTVVSSKSNQSSQSNQTSSDRSAVAHADVHQMTYDELVNLEFDSNQNQSNEGWRGFLLALKKSN
jgi:hypothetical protein